MGAAQAAVGRELGVGMSKTTMPMGKHQPSGRGQGSLSRAHSASSGMQFSRVALQPTGMAWGLGALASWTRQRAGHQC